MSICYQVYLFAGYKIKSDEIPEEVNYKITEIIDDDFRNANGRNTQLIHDQMGGGYIIVGKTLASVEPDQDCGYAVDIEPQNVTMEWSMNTREEILEAYPELKDILEDRTMSIFLISHAW